MNERLTRRVEELESHLGRYRILTASMTLLVIGLGLSHCESGSTVPSPIDVARSWGEEQGYSVDTWPHGSLGIYVVMVEGVPADVADLLPRFGSTSEGRYSSAAGYWFERYEDGTMVFAARSGPESVRMFVGRGRR